MNRLESATLPDLLAERRANVLEQTRETNATARAMLGYHIAAIDREVERRGRDRGRPR